MSTTSAATGSPARSPAGLLLLGLGVLAAAFLAWQAVHFWVQAPLHYIVDQTEQSFKQYWPVRGWLLLHIAGGTLALFTGPFQLWTGLRRRALRVHRLLGYTYLAGIAMGGTAGFALSFRTEPADFAVALFSLAFAWWLTVGMAFVAIRRGRIEAHREWMIRGYVVTFAFVAFRYLVDFPVWAPLGPARAATVGWLCWVIPLMLAEVGLQWKRTVGRTRLPASAGVP